MQNKRMITQPYKRIMITLLTVLTLSGCSWGTKPNTVVVSTEHVNTCQSPPNAGRIVMKTPKFYVVRDTNGVLWISVTPIGYQKMSENTAEILSHIKKKNTVIRYYKKCVENDKDSK